MEHPYNHVQISKKKKSEESYCINFMPGSGTKNLLKTARIWDLGSGIRDPKVKIDPLRNEHCWNSMTSEV